MHSANYPRSLLVRAFIGSNAQEITEEIGRFVGYGPYSDYVIGITDDAKERYIAHGRPARWQAWMSESEVAARSVERFFLTPGLAMQGGVGGKRAEDLFTYFTHLAVRHCFNSRSTCPDMRTKGSTPRNSREGGRRATRFLLWSLSDGII